MIDKSIIDEMLRKKTVFETCKNYVISGIVGATVVFEEFVNDMELDEETTENLLETAGLLFIKAMDSVKDEEFIE